MKDINKMNGKANIEAVQNLDSIRKNGEKVEQIINVPTSQLHRHKTSINLWRSAITSAERPATSNPTFYELVRLWNELASDSEVKYCTNIRVDNVLSKDCVLYKDGEILEDVNAYNFFKQSWMQDFMKYALESKFFGFSGIRIGDICDYDNPEMTRVKCVESISRQHINPKLDLINENYQMNSGVSFYDDDIKDSYILVKEKDGENRHYKGLFNDIFAYFQYLKDSQKAMNDFIAKFGSAAVIVKTELTNSVHRQNLINFLEQFQGNSYALLGVEDEIETVQPSNSNGESFEKIITEMKGNISKVLLGSTSLGSESSFVGSVEASEKLLSGISRADMNDLESIINHELIPRLVTLGISWIDGIKFKFDTAVKEDPTIKLEQVKVLSQLGYVLDSKQLEELFGLKINGFQSPSAPIEVEDKEEDKKEDDK